MNCRICGEPVDPRRVELGYDYCLKERCQQLCVKRVELASVGVNKAADYYTRAEELVPARLPRSGADAGDEPEDLSPSPGRPVPAASVRESRSRPSALDRLRALERPLERRLAAGYERFERGEITAAEMDRERKRLTADFNRAVRGENIRYRSMQRADRSERT